VGEKEGILYKRVGGVRCRVGKEEKGRGKNGKKVRFYIGLWKMRSKAVRKLSGKALSLG